MPDSDEILRERILRTAYHIQRHCRSDVPPGVFYPGFLNLLMNAFQASAGAVWVVDAGGQIERVCDVNWPGIETAVISADEPPHKTILAEVFSNGQLRSVEIGRDASGGSAQPGLLLLAGLNIERACAAVAEVLLDSRPNAHALAGYQQFLEQMAVHGGTYLARTVDRSSAAAAASDSVEAGKHEHGGNASRGLPRPRTNVREANAANDPVFWSGFAEMALRLQLARDVRDVASVAVHDGRSLIGCDRCSLLRYRGRKLVSEAVSGLDAPNARSNQLQALVRFAAEVLKTGDVFRYDGSVERLPAAVEVPLAAYITESGSRALFLVPLFEPPSAVPPEKLSSSPEAPPTLLGAWIVEAMSAQPLTEATLLKARFLADHISAALFQAVAHERIFLRSLWLRLGRLREWLRGRKLAQLLAVLAGLAALILALACIPWTYAVSGDGQLLPVVQRAVFAPGDGEVEKIFVNSGDAVKAGQPLVRLWNAELHAQLAEVRSGINQKQQEQLALEVQIDNAVQNVQRDDELRLRGELRETVIRIRGLQTREQLLAGREARLTVLAPIAGTIATFQLEQLLSGRPVERGETLLEVMDEAGPWQLEVDVEEHRLNHILQAQHRSTNRLDVEFILATAPEVTYTGHLERLATRPRLDPQQGSVMPVFVALEDDRLPDRRIGAQVRARVLCGKRSLGYVLFGDVLEFLQRKFWL